MVGIKRTIAGNLGASFLGRLITALRPILLVPLMIHTWGLEIYGEWLILAAIPTYIMLSPDLGLAGAVTNRMAYLTTQGNEQEAIFLYRSSFVVLFVAAGTFVGLGTLIAWFMNWSWFGITSLKPTVSITIVSCLLVQIFIAQQGSLLSGIYRSARQNPRLGLFQSASHFFNLAVSLTVLWFNGSPSSYAIALAFAYAFGFLVLFIDSRRIMPNFTLARQGVSFIYVRPYIVQGLGFAGMPLVNALQNESVLIVVGAILGPTSVGLFQTARTLSNGVKSLVSMLASAIMVELPALLGEDRKEIVEHILVRNTQIGVILAMCSIVVVVFSGNIIYHLWLGHQVLYHPVLVLLLFVSVLPFVAGQSFSILLMASNQIHLAILPFIAVGIISIGCVGLGGGVVGVSGVALGIIVWEVGISTVAAIIVSKTNLKMRGYFLKCLRMKSLYEDLLYIRSKIFR